MKKYARDNRPLVKPVKSIEVDQKHIALRVVLFAVLLVVGVVAIVYGVSGLLADQSGWQTVTAQSSEDADCSDEFTLQYEFGKGDLSAKAEYNQLAALYTEATVKAYRLFHEMQTFDSVRNIAYLNDHPGESVEVDSVLYDALALMNSAGGRQLFLAPIYKYYEQLFQCTEDFEIESYDPALNAELAALFAKILAYANDPGAISLELLGENRVCLHISDAYQDFAAENDVYAFIGFHWMKNAFIADYLASTLIENGFTHGAISSYDGFIRNLDDRGTSYSLTLFDRVGNTIHAPGTLNYAGRRSIVSLRAFPAVPADNPRYYVMKDGRTRFPYLDAADGLCRAATESMVCYSDRAGCAEILLAMIPVYIADSFDPAPLIGAEGIEAIYCRDGVIWHTAESAEIVNVGDGYEVKRVSQ